MAEDRSLIHFRPSEHEVVKRLRELSKRAADGDHAVLTDFLTPRELQIGLMMANHTRVSWHTFGGHPNAERKRGLFYDRQWVEPVEDEFGIACVKVDLGKNAERLSHGDFLGSLMGLGLDRARFGDIVLVDEHAYVFCVDSMLSFLRREWLKVGRHTVSISDIGLDSMPDLPASRMEERTVTMQSLRLDAFVGYAFSISRSKAIDPIKAGRVQLNFVVCADPSEEIQEGDIVSLRGSGRARILAVEGSSRSGRIFVRIGRYI